MPPKEDSDILLGVLETTRNRDTSGGAAATYSELGCPSRRQHFNCLAAQISPRGWRIVHPSSTRAARPRRPHKQSDPARFAMPGRFWTLGDHCKEYPYVAYLYGVRRRKDRRGGRLASLITVRCEKAFRNGTFKTKQYPIKIKIKASSTVHEVERREGRKPK